MKVTIYCASSAQIHQKYFYATELLATTLAANKIKVVFGGGAEGLMGHLANTVVEQGGEIQGIMPHFMKEIEWAHPKVMDFIFTDTMSERKTLLYRDTDAIIALPGGTGTLEELFEVITLKRLGEFTKPIVILNTDNYYGPLQEMLERCVDEKFMNPQHLDMWSFVDHPSEVLPAIENMPDWSADALNYATLKQS